MDSSGGQSHPGRCPVTTFLITVSALATWLGLCAVTFRAPAFVATVATLIHRHGGRHAR